MIKNCKKIIFIMVLIILLWISMFAVDLYMVYSESTPIFCISDEDKGHYAGLCYSYDVYKHPITEKNEYCMYLFGIELKSNFTN